MRIEPARSARPILAGLLALGLLALAGVAARTAGLGGEWFVDFADLWLYHAVFACAIACCVVRAVTSPGSRAIWLAFALGLFFWAAADVYWTVEYTGVKRIPYPNASDLGYLLSIPCFFAGIALMTKRYAGRFGAANWLDAAIGSLAAAAAGTAVLAPTLVGLVKGNTAAVIANIGYPLGDLVLISIVVGALVVVGLRSAGPFLAVGAGLAAWTFADASYLLIVANDSYEAGGWVDVLWPAAALAIGSATLVPARARTARRDRRPSVLLPSFFATVAVGVLIYDHFDRVIQASVWLAGLTLLLVIVRLALAFRENDRLVESLHEEAVTDALTGLGNRRLLFKHLDGILAAGSRRVVAIFDLDGFKHYNDTFGHPAGDALLRRLGANLVEAVRGHGAAYRLGGDEFCILVRANKHTAEWIVAAAREALSERGEGFSISASCGAVFVPDAAATSSEAMRLADRAMYEEKSGRSGRIEQQTREVLLRIMREREPRLSQHGQGVALLASEVGRALRLDAEDLDVLTRAAELHDVGKIAIPAEVLHKSGRLDEIEWELMRKHTLIGERIIGAAQALVPVARTVRSSHERWDGGGYPDGLAGEEIPLASRIVFVCDAFDAMIAERCYRPARTPEEALGELRRHAGTQFDPDIVEVFCALRESPRRGSGVAAGSAADPR